MYDTEKASAVGQHKDAFDITQLAYVEGIFVLALGYG
jgi:hypothetical protein